MIVDAAAIEKAIAAAKESDRPSLIACKTVIGFGSPNKEGTSATHGAPLGDDEIAATRARIDQAHGQVDSPVLVHPQATVASDNRLGPGTVMAAGARVTTNVTTGRHTHLNVNAVVSHDSVLGDHVTLSPGVLVNGSVRIDDRAFLGTGAIVLPGRHIGADAVIGAGAVVTDDVAPGRTVMGVPAR